MEYGGETLSDVMKRIPKDDNATRWSLFAQCVQGLNSIHDQGFFHRDIKAANIFVRDGMAKIGDLGLSTDAQMVNLSSAGSSGVGTLLYSAPEVHEGKYQKADIFSLGIVLVELFSNFTTGMERVEVLKKIRENCLPEKWTQHTDEAILARMMVNQNPANRPTAREILQQLVQRGRSADTDNAVLLNVIKEQKAHIDRLEHIIKKKDDEMAKLRILLAVNNINIPD